MPASALLGAAATFAQNRTEAIHRWYPYVEGFSSGFVSRLLAEHPRARSVLDPFAGSGTTPLVASHAGLSCGYCEVNPVMRLAARAKLEAAPALASRGRAGVLEAFRRAGSLEGEIQERAKAVDLSPLSFTFEKRAFFEEAVLRDLLAAVSWIGGAARGDSALADLLRLALASIVVSCSNMKRAADLRYRRGREVHEVERSVARALSGRLACMRDDLVALAETLAEGGTLGKATLLSEDARELPLEQAGEIDLALTSPPYLNGTNYMRNSKLELLVLGFIRGESELAALHTRALTAGINGVSRRIAEPARFPEVEAVARKLDRCAYDKRIPALVRAYASDMERVLSRTATLLRPGGALLLDIGDSHFCGVNVPTDELLVALARLSGLRHVGATFLRKRSSNGGAPLKQVLLRFKKEKKKRTTEAQRTQSDRGEVSSATPPRPRRLRGANRSTAKAAREFARELPYRELPYSRRNWGHPWHSLCSYQGKLKPGLAHHLVSRFTRPGETVLDPLGGVGTIAFEACLAGRRGISNDVNPVAHACARAKLGRPDAGECFALLGRLERALAGARPRKRRLPRFNGELASYYHPTTLGEILRARAFFLGEGIAQAPRSSSEALVLASLLHVLHGNRPYALSRRSHPLTPFAPSGPFVEKALVPHV
ncbi:DNA methylase, partial [bacterium]|nr:DNA methylase [bacterium]